MEVRRRPIELFPPRRIPHEREAPAYHELTLRQPGPPLVQPDARGERFGPVYATDQDGRRWRVETAVFDHSEAHFLNIEVVEVVYTARAVGDLVPLS